MNSPRVLHVDSGREWRGGQRQVFLLAAGMKARGLDTAIVAPAGSPLMDKARTREIATFALPLRGDLDVSSALALRRLAQHWKPDVIHAHDAHAHGVALVSLVWRKGPPLVVTRRVTFPPRNARWKYGRRVTRFIAISEAVRQTLLAAGIPAECISVVHSGVQMPPKLRPRDWRALRGWPRAAVICGVVGAMTAEKGISDLDAIAGHLPDDIFRTTRVVLIGGTTAGSTTVGGVEAYRAGFLPEVEEAIAGLDVLWHPSRSEGLGTVVIDAMALGVPPIAFAVGGLPELIQDGVSGRLVRANDTSAFARAAGDLIRNATLRKRLSEGAARRAREFTDDLMTERTLEVYEMVMRGSG
ncbi:MAG TPA: glycosyltransferase family 4 protein [Gemmatimonadaceae bacterium]